MVIARLTLDQGFQAFEYHGPGKLENKANHHRH